MIRIVFGSALSLLGLGAAATLLAPELATAPRGEPLVVAAPQAATVQQASFDGAACASTLVLSEEDLLRAIPQPAGTHVVTLVFGIGEDGSSTVVERGDTDPAEGTGLALVFNDEGRILYAAPTRVERERVLSDVYAADCLADPTRPSGV